DQGEQPDGHDRARQVIEQMIAPAIDDAGFEDGVVQAGVAYDLFGQPLRFVIARSAVRPRAQEAHQRDFPDAGAAGRVDDRLRALDVDPPVGLPAYLAIDPGAVGYGVAAFECA